MKSIITSKIQLRKLLGGILRNFSVSEDHKDKIFRVRESSIEKTPITSQLWNRRQIHEEVTEIVNSNVILVEKNSTSSRLTLSYNFMSDVNLRDSYADARGNILIGKLLEDLDAFAGNIAQKHCENEKTADRPLSLVTASVDKITLAKLRSFISIRNDDLVLAGQVCWVGKSSMDIIMELHSKREVLRYNNEGVPILLENSGNSSRLLSSYFTFVARDKATGKAVHVNQFRAVSEAEIQLFQERQGLASARKTKDQYQETSKDILRALVERGCAIEDMPALAHPNAVLIRSTSLENSFLCQPQSCNTAGRVFG